MGYRSCGAMCIEGPIDEMAILLATVKLAGGPHTKELLGEDDAPHVTVETRGNVTRWELKFDNWKWYHGYSDINCFEQFWSDASNKDKLNGFRWRQGEDDIDAEVDRFGASIAGAYVKSGLRVTFHPTDDVHVECVAGKNYFAVIAGTEYGSGGITTSDEELLARARALFEVAGALVEQASNEHGVVERLLITKDNPTKDEFDCLNEVYGQIGKEFDASHLSIGCAVIEDGSLEMKGSTYFDDGAAGIHVYNSMGYDEWLETEGA